MSYPRKPPQLKAISGTIRKDRDEGTALNLPTVEGLPDAPKWLPNVNAVLEFNRLAAILFNNRLLTEGAVSSLGHLAALHGTLVQQWTAGKCPSGHLMAQYRNLINDFGLTPVSSSKIGGGASIKKSNKFANNGKR